MPFLGDLSPFAGELSRPGFPLISFDTATFCLGQLVSHEPQLISELSFAHTVVEGLSCALRKGWNVHHGVGKFAANALTILSISEAAVPAVREFAIDELLHGLAQW